MNSTDAFVEYLFEMNTSIPERVIDKAKQCVMDYLGAVYAGASVNRTAFDQLQNMQEGKCTVFGCPIKTDELTASFINGYNAHTVEMDDGHRFGMIHLGASIISAVLAVGEIEKIEFRRILSGIVIGYEAAVRMAVSVQPGHKKRGFHTSGTCGTAGAAIGAAFALGYDREEVKSTISAAATSAAGLLEIQEDSSQLKPYNIAHASMSGVMAARIGKCRFVPPDDMLGGKRGALRILSDFFSKEKLIHRSELYEIERIYVKPYAACRHCHSAIEGAISIAESCSVLPKEVKRIDVYTYELAVKGHDHKKIRGVASAKLSLPYSVAAAFVRKSGGLEIFGIEEINDKDILAMTDKVHVIPVEEFTAASPDKRISEVHVVTQDHTYCHRVDYAKGEPENPLLKEEIEEKFIHLMKWAGQGKAGNEVLRMFSQDVISTERLFRLLN